MNLPQPEQQALPLYRVRPKAETPFGSSVITTPMQQPAVQVVENEKGWLQQQGEDLWALVAGIPHIIWNTAKQYSELDPGAVLDGLLNDPKAVGSAINRSLGDLLYGATEHYRNQSGHFTAKSIATAPFRRPLLTALDGLTLLSLGTAAGVRGATTIGRIKARPWAAKLEALAADAAKTGQFDKAALAEARAGYQAAQAGSIATAKKFRDIGGAPVRIIRKGLDKLQEAPYLGRALEAIGFDKIARDDAYLLNTIRMQITGDEKVLLRELIKKDIGKDLYDEFIDVNAGLKPLNPAEYPVPFQERARLWAAIVGEVEEANDNLKVIAANGLPYNAAMREGARLKKLQERMRAHGLPEAESWDAVKRHYENTLAQADALGTGDIQRRLYWSAVVDNSGSMMDAFYDMMEPVASQTQKRAGFLENFLGRSKYQKNPNVWQAHYLRNNLWFRGTIEGMRALERERGMLHRRDAIPEDRVELPLPFRKHLDYQAEATALMMNIYAREALTHGFGSAQAFANTVLKAGEEFGDFGARMAQDIADGAMEDMVITVPKSTARMINQELEPLGGFGRLYDKGMNYWRDLVLTFMPRFYVNNLLGNSLLMTFAGHMPFNLPGRHLEPLVGAEAGRANFFAEEGNFGSAAVTKLRNALADIQYKVENRPRVLMTLRNLGVNLRNIETADKLISAVGLSGSKLENLEKLMEFSLKARKQSLATQGSVLTRGRGGVGPEDLGHQLEQQMIGERLLKDLEELRAPAEAAHREMEHWLGAYGKLTPFERKYIRRVIPFWTFGKTMANVMFHMPLIRPKTTWLYSAMAQMAIDAWEDERLPDYLRGSIWLGTSPTSGMTYFTRLAGFNPFEMLQTRDVGRVPLPQLLDPTNAPLLGAMVKLVGGYDQFSHRPPPLQEDQMIDNVGRVWAIDSSGKATRVSPQMPWTDVLGEIIPQTSIFNDLMAWSGFQVPGRGPKLYQMPDGTMFNPRHWAWGLANAAMRSAGVGVQAINLDKARAQQRVQTIRLIRHLGKQAVKAADEDDRAQFMKLARHAIESLNGR